MLFFMSLGLWFMSAALSSSLVNFWVLLTFIWSFFLSLKCVIDVNGLTFHSRLEQLASGWRPVMDGAFSSACLYVSTWGQTVTCAHATLASLQVAHSYDQYSVASEKLCATAITLHSPNWADGPCCYTVNKTQWTGQHELLGEGMVEEWRKQHLAELCSGSAAAVIDLR